MRNAWITVFIMIVLTSVLLVGCDSLLGIVAVQPPNENPAPTSTPFTPTPTVSATSSPTITPSVTPTPQVSSSPVATSTPLVSATPLATPTPMESVAPSVTPTPVITPTPTPVPSLTPTPTMTVEQELQLAADQFASGGFLTSPDTVNSVTQNFMLLYTYYAYGVTAYYSSSNTSVLGISSPSSGAYYVVTHRPFDTDATVTITATLSKYDGAVLKQQNASIVLIVKQISYAIGDTGPAGGLIFYINPNSISDGWTYLECMPDDEVVGTAVWGKSGTTVTGTSTAVGSGLNNTFLIEDLMRYPPAVYDTAAQLAYEAWFTTSTGTGNCHLPSKDELALMYTNLKMAGLGNFAAASYWSSSQADASNAWSQSFADGTQSSTAKSTALRVRVIRSF